MRNRANRLIVIRIILIVLIPPAILIVAIKDLVGSWTAILSYFTFLVAISAVGGEWLRDFIGLRPQMVLTLHTPKGELANADANSIIPSGDRYYHLRVSNDRKVIPATNVRVVIRKILKPDANGFFRTQFLSDPSLPLNWQASYLTGTSRTIGQDAICDLGRIQADTDRFELTPVFQVSPFPGFINANQKMRLVIQAVNDIYESNMLYLQIKWDGKWSNNTEEMSDHLEVKQISRADTIDGAQ